MSVNLVNNPTNITDGLTPLNSKVSATSGNSGINDSSSPLAKIEVLAVKELSKNKVDGTQVDVEKQSTIQVEPSQLTDAVKTISDFISMPVRSVNFTRDDGSEKTVIKIFDTESQELIKQFPSEEILAIAQRIVELRQDVSQKTGILLDESI